MAVEASRCRNENKDGRRLPFQCVSMDGGWATSTNRSLMEVEMENSILFHQYLLSFQELPSPPVCCKLIDSNESELHVGMEPKMCFQ